MFSYIKMPLMEEAGDTGGSATGAVAGAEATTTETAGTQTGATEGEAGPVPDGSKPSAAWMEMRRKAQEADALKVKLGEYEKNLKSVEDYEKKLKRLEKALPDGFNSIDEFLESDEYRGLPERETPQFDKKTTPKAVDESVISSIARKAIEEHPDIKKAKTYSEREEKRMEDEYLVTNVKKLQEKFPEIKEIKDVPYDVLEAWLKTEVDSKKYGRTLISYYYEMKGDELIENAKKQGINQVKKQSMGVAHTTQVQGTNEATDYDDVTVPEDVKQSLMSDPLLRKALEKDPNKIKYYYKKFHR